MVALFVVVTFIIFILVDIFILKAQKKKHPAFESSSSPVFNKKSLVLPKGIFISPGHTWALAQNENSASIGIDDLIFKALGKISISQIAHEGDTVKRGDIIIQGVSGKKNFSFRSPLNGTINKVNADIIGKEIDDPYSNWAVQLKPSRFSDDIKDLKSGPKLADWLNNEFTRFREFLNLNLMKPELAGHTMLDGGNIVEGAVAQIGMEAQNKFEHEFLTF